jgi:very-short-patch-repair endonuclease
VKIPVVARAPNRRRHIDLTELMQSQLDLACMELAATQHWLITRDQVLDLGLSRHALDRRRRSGLLIPLFSGIYRVAAAPQSWPQYLLAACLWAPGTASHRSALRLHGIDGYSGEIVEVTSTAHRVSSAGARIHQASSLPPSDVMRVGPIPATSSTRTLLDVGCVLPQKRLEEALDSALRQRLTTLDRLRAGIERLGGRGSRGPGELGKLLELRGDVIPTDSALETRLSRLLRRHRMPQPQRQVEVHDGRGFIGRLDFAYPELMIAIEVQSYRWHSSRTAWRNDMARLNRLQALGWIVIQITYEDLVHRPDTVAQRITSAIGSRRDRWAST